MSAREAPASIGQRLLWFLEHYRPDTASLNCPVVCHLHGELDIAALRTALERLTLRHEALRTTLVRRGRQLIQQVHDQLSPPFELVPADPQAVMEAVTAELKRPIDITRNPLRVTLWQCSPEHHIICLNMHHLVSDAWSCGVVLQDLIKLLDAGDDREPDLAPITLQYSDFARWQHEQLTSGAFQRHQDYWLNQLRDMKLIPLPPATPVAPGQRASGVQSAMLDAELFGRLKNLARSERTTPFAVMLSLYYLLLARMTGQHDLSLGSLFANRSLRGSQTTVGFFANMVVLRAQVDPAASFLELLRQVRTMVVNGFLHEAIPYQMLPIHFQNSGGRVDDVVFQMLLTPPPGTKVTARGVDFVLHTSDALGSRFGLEMGLIPQPSGDCQAMLFYTFDRFSPQWAHDFLRDYIALAKAAAARPHDSLLMSGVSP